MVGSYASLCNCTIFHLTYWDNSSHNKHGTIFLKEITLDFNLDLVPNSLSFDYLFVKQLGLNVITELVIGYIYPGKPLANVAFKTYGYISMVQALNLLGDFKLGHYMKIPPKSMFIVQVMKRSKDHFHHLNLLNVSFWPLIKNLLVMKL